VYLEEEKAGIKKENTRRETKTRGDVKKERRGSKALDNEEEKEHDRGINHRACTEAFKS
jgi:hypothetical protein